MIITGWVLMGNLPRANVAVVAMNNGVPYGPCSVSGADGYFSLDVCDPETDELLIESRYFGVKYEGHIKKNYSDYLMK